MEYDSKIGNKLNFISYIYGIKARQKLNTLSKIATFVDSDKKTLFFVPI